MSKQIDGESGRQYLLLDGEPTRCIAGVERVNPLYRPFNEIACKCEMQLDTTSTRFPTQNLQSCSHLISSDRSSMIIDYACIYVTTVFFFFYFKVNIDLVITIFVLHNVSSFLKQ